MGCYFALWTLFEVLKRVRFYKNSKDGKSVNNWVREKNVVTY